MKDSFGRKEDFLTLEIIQEMRDMPNKVIRLLDIVLLSSDTESVPYTADEMAILIFLAFGSESDVAALKVGLRLRGQ